LVDRAAADAVAALGVPTWEPYELVALHLKDLLRVTAAEYVDLQTVAAVVRRTGRIDAVEAAGGLPRFASVLAALLAEQVPVGDIDAITEVFVGCADRPTYEIPEDVRQLPQIMATLPGRAPDTPVFAMGERISATFAAFVRRSGSTVLLAIPGKEAQAILAAVRAVHEDHPVPATAVAEVRVLRLAEHDHLRWKAQRRAEGFTWGPVRDGRQHPDVVDWAELPENSRLEYIRTARRRLHTEPRGRAVLIVDDWRLRPFVRSLIEIEFPQLAVVSRREVGATEVVATVELRDG
jgi:type III secretory pathway component EscV